MFETQQHLSLKDTHTGNFCVSDTSTIVFEAGAHERFLLKQDGSTLVLEEKKLLAGLAVVLSRRIKRRRSKKRRKLVKGWIGERQELEVFNNLVQELASKDKEAYHQYFRLDEEKFNIILNYIKPSIKKQDTTMRKSIQPAERFAITLRFSTSVISFTATNFFT